VSQATQTLDQTKKKAVALADKAKRKADAWKNDDKQALS
jgi:hypothetical protein